MAPNAPPVGDLRHADALLGQAEERGDLPAVVPDALALRVDVERPVAVRHGERRLRLEERVLDELRAERLADDVRGAGERGVDVAALHARVESTLPLVQQRRVRERSNGSVTGSSTSYSTSTSAAASRAAWRVSAATAARTSPT